jgi:hypothetical protein
MIRHAIAILFTLLCSLIYVMRPVQAATPFRALGWYTDPTAGKVDRFTAYRAAGMTIVELPQLDPSKLNTILAQVQAAGLKALLRPNQSWVSGSWTGLRSFVTQYRNNPAVYGWYLADEPDWVRSPVSPRRLARAYRMVKALDPNHPVAVNFVTHNCRFGPRAIKRRYLAGFDLLMFDDYPFYTITTDRQALREFHRDTRNCVASAQRYHKLGPIMVAQGFGGLHDGPYTWRSPTLRDERSMVRDALATGTLGILFYSDQYASPHLIQTVGAAVHTVRSDINHVVQ